ncbi:unnamed protein product [Brugia timori]|uniref:Uncharacterized protein n=1 Tax=Brugia timori TaxID=42155 RepID=A0A3P8A600_9BILA|nr:unnamed protein product [Brugia timori]
MQAKFERSRFSSPRVTPINSEEPGKEKTSDNASREASETPKTSLNNAFTSKIPKEREKGNYSSIRFEMQLSGCTLQILQILQLFAIIKMSISETVRIHGLLACGGIPVLGARLKLYDASAY